MSRHARKTRTFTRAVGYVRNSTRDQADNVRSEVQDREIRAWCETRGIEIIEVLNVNESGWSMFREGMDRVRVLARDRAMDLVVAYDQDRAFRNEYVRRMVEEEDLAPNGVEMRFVLEPEDMQPKDRKLMRAFKGGMAEYYADQVREWVTEALIYKAMNGEYCGGRKPYGYTTRTTGERVNRHGKRKPIKKLAPDPVESLVVRFAKELYAWGRSDVFPLPDGYEGRKDFGQWCIAVILNKLGHRTRYSNEWTKQSIARIIKDDDNTHIGTFHWNKRHGSKDARKRHGQTYKQKDEVISIPNSFPAIVDAETQAKCQEKAKANKKRSPRSFSSDFLLSERLLHCPCGSPMSGFTRKAGGRHKKDRKNYICSARRNGQTCEAKCPTIKKAPIEEVMVETVLSYMRQDRVRDRIMEYARGLLADRSGDRAATIKLAQRRVVDIENLIGNVKGHLRHAPAEVSGELYKDLADLVKQRGQAEAHLARVQMGHDPAERARHLETVEEMITGVEALWAAASPEEKKAILKGFIKRADLSLDPLAVKLQIRIPVLFGELADLVEVEVPQVDLRRSR